MTPEQAVEALPNLVEEIDELAGELAADVLLVEQQWESLGRVGGQRADHAAALLANLLPTLRRLARHTIDCAKQIEALRADPFGCKS